MKLPWRAVSVTPGGWAIDTSLTESESRQLEELARDKRVLEVGAAYGYSTVLLARVARHVVSVDHHQYLNSLNRLLHSLQVYGVTDRVTVHACASADVLPYLSAASFDLIFIDGDHSAAAVEFDAQQARRLIRPGGALAFHDYGEESCPDVAPTLERLFGAGRLVDTLFLVEATCAGS